MLNYQRAKQKLASVFNDSYSCAPCLPESYVRPPLRTISLFSLQEQQSHCSHMCSTRGEKKILKVAVAIQVDSRLIWCFSELSEKHSSSSQWDRFLRFVWCWLMKRLLMWRVPVWKGRSLWDVCAFLIWIPHLEPTDLLSPVHWYRAVSGEEEEFCM